jgi:hypothetical protein
MQLFRKLPISLKQPSSCYAPVQEITNITVSSHPPAMQPFRKLPISLSTVILLLCSCSGNYQCHCQQLYFCYAAVQEITSLTVNSHTSVMQLFRTLPISLSTELSSCYAAVQDITNLTVNRAIVLLCSCLGNYQSHCQQLYFCNAAVQNITNLTVNSCTSVMQLFRTLPISLSTAILLLCSCSGKYHFTVHIKSISSSQKTLRLHYRYELVNAVKEILAIPGIIVQLSVGKTHK